MYAVVSDQRNRNVLVRYWFFNLGLYSSLGFYTMFWTKSLGSAYSQIGLYTKIYSVSCLCYTDQQDSDYELVKKLAVQIEEQRQLQSTKDDKLLKRYRMRDDYTCIDKQVTLKKGQIVEVLDTENQVVWLVRQQDDKQKVENSHQSLTSFIILFI